jgi:alpha-glucosidase (family GH31 glycosyl hydrolase)
MNEVWGVLIDIGVDGIKIDFCETMPDEGNYSNFSLKYKWYDPSVFEGDNVHHAYSTYFISLFYKSMIEQKEAKNIPDGFIVLSRGGGIGSQRNPYLWEGDQGRTFEKIEDQLIALINSGISGVPFMTYDMAGYAYQSGTQFTGGAATSLETESEIFARAIEFTAFTSNIQTHGDVRHAYQMTEETQEIYRRYTDIHEKLIPYIQKYSKVASDSGIPVVRAMVLHYQNDVNVYDLETQYMFGDALLVAPVTTGATVTKAVYLPEGRWLDLLTGESYEVGAEGMRLTVDAELGKLPVFLNIDCSIEDNNLLLDVFNSEAWQKINDGVDLGLEYKHPKGDPWAGDVFDD